MNLFIQIILIIIAILIGAMISFQIFKRNLSELSQQLEDKIQTKSNVRIMNETNIKVFDALICQINQLHDEKIQKEIDIQNEQKMLEQTLHNVSHDIRTPLTISMGKIHQLLDEEHHPKLIKVYESLQQISKRLEDLLEFQDLLEQNISAKNEPVNLSRLLTQELMTYYDAINQAHFETEIHIEDNLWIESDSNLIERILQNIFGNVLKHGKNYLKVNLIQDTYSITLSISNESKQEIINLDKLTHRFYAEDLSTTEKSSGLGLYIVENLSELALGALRLNYDNRLFTVQIQWKTYQTIQPR